MVLYTDGLLEARSASGEQFGLQRVIDLLRADAVADVESIQAELLRAARAWTPVQQDDMTVLVLRRPLAAREPNTA